MDSYARYLLGLAVEEAQRRGEWINFFPPGWWPASSAKYPGDGFAISMYLARPQGTTLGWPKSWRGATLADALAARLGDLGVEVPERPSAERVRAAYDDWRFSLMSSVAQIADDRIEALRDLYAREPLTVLALLDDQEARDA